MIHPLKDNILIEQFSMKDCFIGTNGDVTFGLVRAFGPDCLIENIDSSRVLEIGNIVFFKKSSSSVVNDGDKEYLLVRQEDIIGVIG